MKVLVSACLLGVRCRFDGASKPSQAVQDALARHHCEIVRMCPEVMGGMPIPHPPHEIVEVDGTRHVVDAEGADHTENFERGAERACELAKRSGCSLAILKAKSPSCGVGRIYDGTFSGTLVPGDGIAAARLRAAGVTLLTEKDFVDGDPIAHALGMSEGASQD